MEYDTIFFIVDKDDGEPSEWHSDRSEAISAVYEDYGSKDYEVVAYRRVFN